MIKQSEYCKYIWTIDNGGDPEAVLVWSLNTNEVHEVAAMANFNLNQTQSLNDTLRAVYMEEEGGNFVALGGGVRNQP